MKTNPSTDIAEPEVVFRKGGLTPEQQAAIIAEDSAPFESLTKEQQKRRYQREAKRKERKGKNALKAEANAAKALEDFRTRDSKLTLGQFWNRNRNQLPEDTRAQYVILHEQVLDQLAWMWDNLYGTYDVKPEEEDFYISLEEGFADMEAFVKEHDILYRYSLSDATNYDRPDWVNLFVYKNDEYGAREQAKQENLATRIWLSCGLLTALPWEFVDKFRKFYWEKKRASETTSPATP
jgi:hypothetical protein